MKTSRLYVGPKGHSTAATVPREDRSICIVGLCQVMCV